MTREQLIKRTNGTQRLQLRGQSLRGFDFSGLNLSGADLSFSDLTKANFEGAMLRGADLSFSAIRGGNFRDADLTDANLSFSDLTSTVLINANLTGTRLNFAAVSAKREPKDRLAEPNMLAKLLQTPFWGLLIGMIAGALVVYGFSGIIYFTAQIAISKDPLMAQLYRFLIIQNVTIGAGIFLVIWLLDEWLNQRIHSTWLRHLLASGATFMTSTTVSLTTFFFFGQSAVNELVKRPEYTTDNAPVIFYILSYLIVGNTFLYVLRQGRQLTRKMSEQEFQLLNMEKLKNRAELDALQAKINPHFLYNALNSIASLVHEDPDKAEEMTLLLSKLFRYSTGRDGNLFTTLADELDMVRTYLRVEQVRFGDRLRFEVEGHNARFDGLTIPQFLLQPLVENAIKHGISKRADEGCIRVGIREEAGWLWLTVQDNGPHFPDEMGGGYGLRSIQDKLRLLYADDARFELQNKPQKQVCIGLKMNRLTSPAAASASVG
ncbi:histidine kinase [Fibrella sp. WM1]|uniref:histidine kinase n=1 Tax=Fibrella musci TaxID=3242485 RepID=UPI003521FDAB